MKKMVLMVWCILGLGRLYATDYHVGPGQSYANIGDVRWDTLSAGDRVFIHWRQNTYQEKWVINRQGTSNAPIEVIGLPNASGDRPIIDGNGAITPTNLSYWNESRGVIKIGGSSIPADGMPSYITIKNLEIKSGRPPYSFTDDNGIIDNYSNNAASIYIEKGQHINIENCILQDSGNGLFVGAFNGQTHHISIHNNYIHSNGNIGSQFEHNSYTAGIFIKYEGNRFGPLRVGANGNNLKDRSAGLVVKYNWIEGGNRQLDLVDAEDTDVIVNHGSYDTTYVYGNILIEPDGDGNSQIVHYGGDSGNTAIYRKGVLYFYHNTVISNRSGNTTLMRLSTNDEQAEMFSNLIYSSAAGTMLAMSNSAGTLNLQYNWIKTGWVASHSSLTGSVNDLGNNLTGVDPMVVSLGAQDYRLAIGSTLIDQGRDPITITPSIPLVSQEYQKHLQVINRMEWGAPDIGAHAGGHCIEMTVFENGSWSNGTPDSTFHAIIRTSYQTSNFGNIDVCRCTIESGVICTVSPGDSIIARKDLTVHGQLDVPMGAILITRP